jgi:hypothetical protein
VSTRTRAAENDPPSLRTYSASVPSALSGTRTVASSARASSASKTERLIGSIVCIVGAVGSIIGTHAARVPSFNATSGPLAIFFPFFVPFLPFFTLRGPLRSRHEDFF